MEHLVILKGKFTLEEAAVLKAKNPSSKRKVISLCDRNGFNMISWEGKTVIAAESDKDDKLTPYMLKKAIEAGAKKG